LIKISRAQLGLFQSESSQLSFVQAAKSKHGAVFVVGGNIISANPEQQERFHVPHPTRFGRHCGPCLSRPSDELRATSRGASASQNLRLLRSEFFLGQHTRRFELPKLLKLAKNISLRWCCWLWRRRRRCICLLRWLLLLVSLLLLVGLRICLLLVLLRPPIRLAPRHPVGHRSRRTGNNRGPRYTTNESHRSSSSVPTFR
jgi:hypothetical protein